MNEVKLSNKVGLKQDGRFFYGWILMVVGFLMMLLAYVGAISITSVFVIPVTEAFGIDRGTFMFYQTIVMIASIITSAYFGKRMAKGNIKLIMAASALITALAYILYANAQSIIWLYFGAVLIGVGFANCTVLPMSIILNNWFGGKVKGTVMGFNFIGSGVGGLILLPILNRVITDSGWEAGYYTLAGMFFLVFLIIIATVVKTPEEKGFVRMGQAEGEKNIKDAEGMVIKEAFKTPMFWMILSTATLTVFGSSAILFNSTPFFIEVGFSPVKAAQIASFNLGMLAIGKPVIGFLSDKLGTKFGSIFAALIFGLQFVFLALTPLNQSFVWLAVVCYGIGGGGITVAPPLLVNALFGEKDYGNIVAAMNMATNLGGAFGGMIAATVYDITGSYVVFWWMAAAAMGVVVIFRLVCFQLRKKYEY